MGQLRPHAAKAAKILLVEDDAVSDRIVGSSLERRGFEVLHAGNAAEAIALLQKHDDVAVVFSDVMMPGEIDGTGLQAWLETNRPGLPVILGSANAAKAKASSHEEFRFFTKPYNMNAVAACIRSLIR